MKPWWCVGGGCGGEGKGRRRVSQFAHCSAASVVCGVHHPWVSRTAPGGARVGPCVLCVTNRP